MPKIFSSSDHHFYHKNIIKYAGRPFDFNDENCVADNAKLMIERHNEIVSSEDIHIFVGDLSASLRGRQEHFKSLLKLMNGRKILVRGNHDHEPDQFYLDAGFIDVVDYIYIPPFFINHYPCSFSKYSKGPELQMSFNMRGKHIETIIHGHIHNKDPSKWNTDSYKRINMCVDFEPNNYYPQELTQPEIVEYFNSKYK